MTHRKVRHPHQVMEPSELVNGEPYAFVTRWVELDLVNEHLVHAIMCGIFTDSALTVRQRGHDLALGAHLGMLIDDPPTKHAVTIHMDGWSGGNDYSSPTIAHWMGSCRSWDPLTTFFGPEKQEDIHYIIVPSQRWDDDGRLHSATWSNPDAVIERAGDAESPADWDSRMRAKYDAAMAKALGF